MTTTRRPQCQAPEALPGHGCPCYTSSAETTGMFRRMGSLVAQNEDGVVWKCGGIRRQEYVRDEHHLLLRVDPAIGPDGRWSKEYIYIPAPLAWQPPHENDSISEAERRHIIDDIIEAELALGSNSLVEEIDGTTVIVSTDMIPN